MMIRIAFTLLALSLGITVAHSNAFLGAQQCQVCHPSQFEQWQGTAHARTHLKLSAAQRRDPRCGICHNTSTENGLLGVQCESCHGPGSAYWPADIMKVQKRARAAGLWVADRVAVCESCHVDPGTRLLPFNFRAALSKVHHQRQVQRRENQ